MRTATLSSYQIFSRRCLPRILLYHLHRYGFPTLMRNEYFLGKIGNVCSLSFFENKAYLFDPEMWVISRTLPVPRLLFIVRIREETSKGTIRC